MANRAPKQWCLTKTETVNSFENWKQNLLYTLSLDPNFTPYLAEGLQWGNKTKTAPLRGMTNDGEDIAAAQRKTAQQKCATLDLMLGQIANYCPVIARNTIIKNSKSLNHIWQTIRLHYGFQSTGGHFLDFAGIHLEPDERHEDLFQRLMAFVEDNLLVPDGGITHNGQVIEEDEELTPTLENFIVLTWLRLIHSDLPRIVKQRYGTELRSRTLASIKPEVSQALDALLDELQSSENARSMRATVPQQFSRQGASSSRGRQRTASQRPRSTIKSCPICKQVGRSDYQHFLSECPFLPDKDRKFILRARQVANIFDEEGEDEEAPPDITCAYVEQPPQDQTSEIPSTHRVQVRQSPYFNTFHKHHTVKITIDSGAEGNLIRESTAKSLNADIIKSTQSAHQADGSSPLAVVGETTMTLSRDGHMFQFHGLVVKSLDVDVLAGIPFMENNDITIRPAKHEIILSDGTTYVYGTQSTNHKPNHQSVRRAHVLRAPSEATTIWPGDYIEVELPQEMSTCDSTFALEPRTDTHISKTLTANHIPVWPRHRIVQSIAGKIRATSPQTSRTLLSDP